MASDARVSARSSNRPRAGETPHEPVLPEIEGCCSSAAAKSVVDGEIIMPSPNGLAFDDLRFASTRPITREETCGRDTDGFVVFELSREEARSPHTSLSEARALDNASSSRPVCVAP